MEEKLLYLLFIAVQQNVSDVHFLIQSELLKITFRTHQGMRPVNDEIFDVNFFNYLKYISDLDLANTTKPQSGQFQRSLDDRMYYFRFSLIVTSGLQTGVLRILNSFSFMHLHDLTFQEDCLKSFEEWMQYPNGFIVMCGPTGSGKTTTLHALLHTIAKKQTKNVISLEDPIEIYDDAYLQLQINEKSGFTYEEGIRQLLRHDPDVIMIGEIRDSNTAKMAYRCALTGHTVFTCVHAKNTFEAIKRLEELGLSKESLKGTLVAVSSQRLMITKERKGRTCIYEILENKELQNYLESGEVPSEYLDIHAQIKKASDEQRIDKEEAEIHLKMETI